MGLAVLRRILARILHGDAHNKPKGNHLRCKRETSTARHFNLNRREIYVRQHSPNCIRHA